jgi:hypothetical protein
VEPPTRPAQRPWKNLKHLQVTFLNDWGQKWRKLAEGGQQWPRPGYRLDELAPSLTSLKITFIEPLELEWGVNVSPPLVPPLRVSHNNLRRLALHIHRGAKHMNAIGIIQNLPLLEDLEVNIGKRLPGPTKPIVASLVAHNNIQRLTLIGCGSPMLNILLLPNLRYLTLRYPTPEEHDVAVLLRFFSRSQSLQLKELRIRIMYKSNLDPWWNLWAAVHGKMGLREQVNRVDDQETVQEGVWTA